MKYVNRRVPSGRAFATRFPGRAQTMAHLTQTQLLHLLREGLNGKPGPQGHALFHNALTNQIYHQ
jgi:hypothetical protein